MPGCDKPVKTKRLGYCAMHERRWRVRGTTDPGPGKGSFQRAKTHCPRGHPYSKYAQTNGKRATRRCLLCDRDAKIARYDRLTDGTKLDAAEVLTIPRAWMQRHCTGILRAEMEGCRLRAAALWAAHAVELIEAGKVPWFRDPPRLVGRPRGVRTDYDIAS